MFGQEGWIIALLTFFMDLHFVSIHSNAEKIFSRRIYSHLHLKRRQERMFICTYEWQVKFFLQFLASGFIYQTTRILFLEMNCLSLNIVPWLPFFPHLIGNRIIETHLKLVTIWRCSDSFFLSFKSIFCSSAAWLLLFAFNFLSRVLFQFLAFATLVYVCRRLTH